MDRQEKVRQPYSKPAIIYQDTLKTRAGSPLSDPKESTSPFDPAELFKE